MMENESIETGLKKEEDVSLAFRLEGMSCPSCALKIEKVLSDLPTVKRAEVDFIT